MVLGEQSRLSVAAPNKHETMHNLTLRAIMGIACVSPSAAVTWPQPCLLPHDPLTGHGGAGGASHVAPPAHQRGGGAVWRRHSRVTACVGHSVTAAAHGVGWCAWPLVKGVGGREGARGRSR